DSLRQAGHSLQAAEEAAQLQVGEELVAIEIREALQHLGQIVGQVYTDDILDRIFSKFCIGK
ncbi:MAG TPA: tRNA uridine-5-carboxymethylaminomethyl(34) synthesis GTPase MnmE, partial [Planctomycetaceae bacterium]|nr:tRNA uridine-5-carboxymethylaminomethyl(34) synthesis GTPase MnmE [Planctomycetaceae bacterium]